MSAVISISAGHRYGTARVCRAWRVSRSRHTQRMKSAFRTRKVSLRQRQSLSQVAVDICGIDSPPGRGESDGGRRCLAVVPLRAHGDARVRGT